MPERKSRGSGSRSVRGNGCYIFPISTNILKMVWKHLMRLWMITFERTSHLFVSSASPLWAFFSFSLLVCLWNVTFGSGAFHVSWAGDNLACVAGGLWFIKRFPSAPFSLRGELIIACGQKKTEIQEQMKSFSLEIMARKLTADRIFWRFFETIEVFWFCEFLEGLCPLTNMFMDGSIRIQGFWSGLRTNINLVTL